MAKGTSYSTEFKQEAVRLTVSSGKSIATIAKDLGVSAHTLYEWRRQARGEGRLPIAEGETLEQKVKRLERELRLVTEERDIIKNYPEAAHQPVDGKTP